MYGGDQAMGRAAAVLLACLEDHVAQPRAAHLLHRVVRPAVVQGADVVHGHHAWVLQVGGDPGLVGEPPQRDLVGRTLLSQDLAHQVPVEHPIEHTPHLAHTAAAEQAEFFIPGTDLARGSLGLGCGHLDGGDLVLGDRPPVRHGVDRFVASHGCFPDTRQCWRALAEPTCRRR